jgi:hypothetical protein
LAVAGGYYYAPDDRIHMTAFNSTDPSVNAMYMQAFPSGEGENHFTAGVGYVLGSHAFHLAVDAAGDGTQAVFSYALTFGTKRK